MQAACQEGGQPFAKEHIKRQTEAGPPTRDPRIVNKRMMDEVEQSMADHSSGYEPQIRLKPEYRNEQEPARNQDLDPKGAR